MSRSSAGVVGVLLILLGIVSLVYGGITYSRDKASIEVGGVELEAETRETIPLPPLLGGLALAGGVVLLIVSRRSGSA